MRSREPTLVVENRLELGSYRFRLVVVDDARNTSAPAELVVRVVEGRAPLSPVAPGPVRPGGLVRPDTRITPVAPAAPAITGGAATRAGSTAPAPARPRAGRRIRPER